MGHKSGKTQGKNDTNEDRNRVHVTDVENSKNEETK